MPFVLSAYRFPARALLPLLLLVALSTALFWPSMGDDLAASYIGCRILAAGRGASLYSHDPENFAGINDADPVWPRVAREGQYTKYLHPYVQTPLWAWSLQPLCRPMLWPAFKHLFILLDLLSMAACIAMTARFWTPRWFTGTGLAVTFLLLLPSEPFFFAMSLVQTHVLLLTLTIAGLLCAEHDRPWLGGLLVACAAAVKITPGILLLYWLAMRRWRAAASLCLCSVLLLGVTRLAVGPAVYADFLANMHRVSSVLLVAENNQSLAATVMGGHFSPDEVFDVNAFALPPMLKTLSLLLMALCAGWGGWVDRSELQSCHGTAAQRTPRFGAAISLVAMTIFAPIAWTHYFLVLVIPLMMLGQAAVNTAHRWKRWMLCVTMLLAALPLYRPLAPDVLHMDLSDYALLRGTFFAGTLCLLALLWVAWPPRRASLEK